MGTFLSPPSTDGFDDEITTPRVVADDGVPVYLDDDATAPVDVGEMEERARRSTTVDEPDQRPRILRRSTSQDGAEMVAEIRVAGTGELLVLPVHSVTASGLSLVIPNDRTVTIATGVAATVHLRGDGDAAVDVKLRASVSHVRAPRGALAGGLSMRWADPDGPVARHVERAATQH